MFAVVKVAGFQYRVESGQVLRVPLLAGKEGDALRLEEVLLLSDGSEIQVGRPGIKGAVVAAEILSHGRTAKTVAGVFKRRRKYRRKDRRQKSNEYVPRRRALRQLFSCVVAGPAR